MQEEKRPRVSVIVPNYNYARYLEERIESILNQTYQDFELILLDDCSTDDSCSILERYASHPKVSHYIPNTQNSGSPFVQWEKGLSLARGEYVWIAEADDSCTPELLEALTSLLEDNQDVVIAYCGSVQINEEGTALAEDYDRWQENHQAYAYKGKNFIYQELVRENKVYNASMTIFKREAWLQLQEQEKEYLGMCSCGDWFFWLKLAELGDVIELRSKLNRFRQHNSRVTVCSEQSRKRLEEHIMITRYTQAKGYGSCSQRHMRRGLLYKQTLRMHRDKEERKQALQALYLGIGASYTDYIFERLCKGLYQLCGIKF